MLGQILEEFNKRFVILFKQRQIVLVLLLCLKFLNEIIKVDKKTILDFLVIIYTLFGQKALQIYYLENSVSVKVDFLEFQIIREIWLSQMVFLGSL